MSGSIVVFLADRFGRRDTHRLEDVDLEVAQHTLQCRGTAFETHAGVDVLLRQRLQVVRWCSDAVELREDEIPNLDRLLRAGRQVINLAARPADAVRSLRRSRCRPEVFALVATSDPARWDFHFVVPDTERLVVIEVHRDAQPFGVEAEPLLRRQKLPRPVDRFLFEVIAERKVAEHLKKRVVIRRHSNVRDVSRPQAHLAGGRAREVDRTNPQKLILELIHPRRREEHRLVVTWNEHIARPADAAFGLEKGEILFAEFVSFHGLLGRKRKVGNSGRGRVRKPRPRRNPKAVRVIHRLRV